MLLAFLQASRHAGTLVAVNGRLIDLARFPANDYTQRLYQLTAAYYRDLTHLFEEVDRLLEDSD